MSKHRRRKGKHRKKTKTRISKSKLFIVALVVLFVGIVVVKATKFTINGAVKVKENIAELAEAVFGSEEDTINVNKDKQ